MSRFGKDKITNLVFIIIIGIMVILNLLYNPLGPAVMIAMLCVGIYLSTI